VTQKELVSGFMTSKVSHNQICSKKRENMSAPQNFMQQQSLSINSGSEECLEEHREFKSISTLDSGIHTLLNFHSKSSKQDLNRNAEKFKIPQNLMTSNRYEVVYKNILRDLRKFYLQDFNEETNYL
jgi:hypothetical protein